MTLFQKCAWCNDFLTDEDEVQKSQAICSTCHKELSSLKVIKIEEISREFLDDLPYGNIILNPDDTVLRYNATEAKYTGYNPSKIEGRNFFSEIAPCTDSPDFKGKLDDFRAIGENGQHLFKFTFDNPHFKALVSILMTYYADSGYTVVSIRKIRDLDLE